MMSSGSQVAGSSARSRFHRVNSWIGLQTLTWARLLVQRWVGRDDSRGVDEQRGDEMEVGKLRGDEMKAGEWRGNKTKAGERRGDDRES
ncbi:hypothetical protein HN51_067618 [Arachis hypogaea]